MKLVHISETRREVREDEIRRLLAVDDAYGLADARLKEHSGKRSVELIFRLTRDHRDVSLDALTGNGSPTAG